MRFKQIENVLFDKKERWENILFFSDWKTEENPSEDFYIYVMGELSPLRNDWLFMEKYSMRQDVSFTTLHS